jgi:hypothetical protein
VSKHQHFKALYVSGFVIEKPMNKMMVDGDVAINIILMVTFRKLGKGSKHLIKTNMILKDLEVNTSKVIRVLNVELTIGSRMISTTFFVIDGKGF